MVKSGEKTAKTLDNIEKVGYEGEAAEKELNTLVSDATSLEDALFDFETGVHPHGYKWWRFRWEYAVVESSILSILILVTMLLYRAISLLTDHYAKYKPSVHSGETSIVNL